LLEETKLRGDQKVDPLGNFLREWFGGTVKVEAGKGLRKDVHVLEIDHPDSFGHGVPEEVLERDIRGTEDTSFGLEVNAILWPAGPTRQGLSRDQFEAGRCDKPSTAHLVYKFLQGGGGGVDERDGGLFHAEEAVLDASAAHWADPIPSGRGHRTSSSIATVSAMTLMAVVVRRARSSVERSGSLIQAWNDGAGMCSMTRYMLPAPSLKTSYTSGTQRANAGD
jgi:hypothetical protein